ncbi:hypothetical protein MRB53_024665 [Persea americana]|uniref:Uncharacterized protein n=1 Tax=Persea americana TaxID=3435 RepID=A0ACC2LD96_PERAE|nr:hypothetical protein MRB53_024665 [Persea americana]
MVGMVGIEGMAGNEGIEGNGGIVNLGIVGRLGIVGIAGNGGNVVFGRFGITGKGGSWVAGNGGNVAFTIIRLARKLRTGELTALKDETAKDEEALDENNLTWPPFIETTEYRFLLGTIMFSFTNSGKISCIYLIVMI